MRHVYYNNHGYMAYSENGGPCTVAMADSETVLTPTEDAVAWHEVALAVAVDMGIEDPSWPIPYNDALGWSNKCLDLLYGWCREDKPTTV